MNFLAIGMDPSESADRLRAYHAEQDYPWPAAVGTPQLVQAYRVTSTAIKLAVNPQGAIVFRRGYGVLPDQNWRDLLQQLAAP